MNEQTVKERLEANEYEAENMWTKSATQSTGRDSIRFETGQVLTASYIEEELDEMFPEVHSIVVNDKGTKLQVTLWV